ncbi:prepilin peptidase [Bacillus sp. B1-b2]|uniref:prepilin peptidase n=1 Tax=Bacillus sp. B1-b2 TaxID=2653201 RepID=UPI001262643F|nr:A24 family peptidase [Bacillus sp. B1-b2]KAB7667341.1 prepilin peptidase [Bacillus sp. B1-b2]
MIYLLIFLYGITLGSFYNVVGLRVPMKESIVRPRSHCSSCGHTLSAMELIPVLSYVLLRGKSKCCKASISPFYPIFELLTGVLFVVSPHILGWSSELFVSWTLISLFIIITVSDLKYMIIPDKVLLFFSVLFIIERFLIPLNPWWDSLLGAAVGFTLLLVIAIVSKGGMGGGDIKLFAVIGFVLGTKLLLVAFFLSTLLGTLGGIAGILTGKVKKAKPIPFGPYIALGTLIAYYYGNQIIQWYLNLLL